MKLRKFYDQYSCQKSNFEINNALMSTFVSNHQELKLFIESYGNKTFNKGLYRTYGFEDAEKWTKIVINDYPEFEGKIICFASDWEGNQYAQKFINNVSTIVIFEISTGDYFELEQTIEGFHEVDLIDYDDETLHIQKFEKAMKYLSISQINNKECIAHKISLLLGGEDTLENLEITDMEVNWSLQQQIMDQINKLPNS